MKREKQDRQETMSFENDEDEEEDNVDEIEECIVKVTNLLCNFHLLTQGQRQKHRNFTYIMICISENKSK
jgi:hypothetical protein